MMSKNPEDSGWPGDPSPQAHPEVSLEGVPNDQTWRLQRIRTLTFQLGKTDDPKDLVSAPLFTCKMRRKGDELVGLAVLDLGLRYLAVNQVLAALGKRTVWDHIGRTVEEVFPDLAQEVVPIFQKIRDTGEPVTDQLVRTENTGNGPRVWLCTYAPIKHPGTGEVVGFSCAVREARP